jgi:urease accessory protein
VYATSPLRLLTPSNHGRSAWIFTSSFGGGLVDGDRLDLRLAVEAGASAYVSSQASTKVYRVRADGDRGSSASPEAGAHAALCARVAEGGLLILAPDPVVCFASARYRQHQRIDIEDGGALVMLDWVTSGRRASGERWAFDAYESGIDIREGGRRCAYDAVALRRDDGDLATRFPRTNVLATLVIAGVPLERESAAVRARLGRQPVIRRAPVLTSAAPLRGGRGVIVRLAGASTQDVAHCVRDLLAFVPALLGDDPWARKW